MKSIYKITGLLLLLLLSINSFAQVKDENNDDDDPEQNINKKALHVGLYLGSLFANKYTANLYDGYGFDYDGNRNNFSNSFMYQKIVVQYGGGLNGQTDQIAEQLLVDHTDWSFNESDMPVNVKYSPAFLIGLNMRYALNRKNSILFNLDVSKLTTTGNFTIQVVPPPTGNINDKYRTFGIKGNESRMLLQAAYQRIFGASVNVNFFLEAGAMLSIAKFDKNTILINKLQIDLADYTYSNTYGNTSIKKPTGAGFGMFAGLGLNLTLNSAWSVQLVYNPSYEKINIGSNAKLKMQNAAGLRAYFNLTAKKETE